MRKAADLMRERHDAITKTLVQEQGKVYPEARAEVMTSAEKQEEKEEKTKDYHLSERSFGSFQRAFQVPSGVDTDKIDAKFSKGVLTVTLPKSTEAQKAEKKITVKSG